MVGLYERAEEKLDVYRSEARLMRGVPRGLWRVRLATVLRDLAGRLEPAATPVPIRQGCDSRS